MKQSKLRSAGITVLSGLAGILANSTGCSSFNFSFQTPINSIRHERYDVEIGKLADKVMRCRNKPFIKDRVLYIDMPSYQACAEKCGVDLSWSSLYLPVMSIGDGITITYRDQKTGEFITREQLIAPDRTIETEWGRVIAESRRITEIDAEIEERARKSEFEGIIETAQVNSYRFGAEPYDFFAGAVNVVDVQNGETVTARARLPMNVSNLMSIYNLGADAKYAIVTVPRSGNFEGNGFDAMMVVADAQKSFYGVPSHNMNLGHNWTVSLTGTNPWRNSRELLQETGGFINDITGISDALQKADKSLDTGFRRNHLERNVQPNKSYLQKAGEALGQVKDITGAASGIKGDVKALVPSPVPVP